MATSEYQNFDTKRFFSDLCGAELRKSGTNTVYRCPRSNGKAHEIYVVTDGPKNGAWSCHHANCATETGCSVSKGGPCHFLQLIEPDLSTASALERLKAYGRADPRGGVSTPAPQKPAGASPEKPKKVWPSLGDLAAKIAGWPPVVSAVGKGGRVYGSPWVYHTKDGREAGAIIRIDGNGKKTFQQVRRVEGGWIAGGLPEPRPLYRLKQAQEGAGVLIVEGEKCADALAGGLPSGNWWVTTPSQGAKSPNKSDWSAVKGREVVIMPDNDPAGKVFAVAVLNLCQTAGASSVRIVYPFYGKSSGDGRDIADFLKDRGDRDAITAAIKEAQADESFTRSVVDSLAEQPDQDTKQVNSTPEKKAPGNTQTKFVLKPISAKSLMDKEFEDPKWIIPGLLCEGYSLLAGRPKRGKSWFALGLSLAVASGGRALGKIQVEQGDVLYLALEDNLRRIQSRIKKILDPGMPIPERLHILTEIPPLDKGGSDAISAWLEDHLETRLIIVDTISHPMFMPPRSRGGDVTREDYEFGARMQRFTMKHNLCLLGLLHTKKSPSEYALDNVAGSTGLTAAPDTVLVLDHAVKGKASAILKVSSREVESQELAMHFENCLWSIMGDADTVAVPDQRKVVLDLLKQYGPMHPKELAERSSSSPGAIRTILFNMRRAGLVTQEGGPGSKYTLPQKFKENLLPASKEDDGEIL